MGVELGDDLQEMPAGELQPRARGLVAGVTVGVIIGALGVLAAMLVLALSDDVTYAPLVGAVAVAVWAAGGTGGIAAVVTGWTLAAWALTAPRIPFVVGTDVDARWAVALVFGIIVAGVGFGMRRGHQRAADAAEQAERSRLRVERLQALAASLSAALTPEEVARVMVEAVPAAIGARGGALGLIEGDELVIVDPAGAEGQTLRPGSRMALTSRAPIAAAAREGKPIWAQRRGEFVSRFADGAALAPYASGALAVPVFMGGRLAGAMGFPFLAPEAITEEVRAVARIAADLGGQALERADLYAQERASREALDRILAVAPRFLRGATTEAVVKSVCAEARRTFGCDVAQVWTPRDSEHLEVTWRDPPNEVLPAGTTIEFADFPGLIDEMRALRSMFVPDVQLHTRGEALRHAQRLGLFSSLRIPIVIGAQFDRILTLQWERVISEPAPSVLAVARRFADQAGLAIEQAERHRAQEQTRSLQAVTEALAAAATPAEVGAAIVRQGVAALGARAATVYALAEDGESVELVASEGYPAEVLGAWKRIAVDAETPVTDAIRSRDVIFCASFEEIATRYPWFDRTEKSFVAAPLIAAGRAIGAVFIGSFAEREHTVADLSVVVGLARQAAQALDRAQLFVREQASLSRLRKLQAVTAALSNAVTMEEVSRTCLEHAAAGVGAREGLVVLPGPGTGTGTGTSALEVVAAIGPRLSSGEIPVEAAAPIAECMKGGQPGLSDEGWAAFSLASGVLAVRLPSSRELASADREWLVTLTGQGAQALDRAGRYETERGIAETLQQSVLPEDLPTVRGIKLAARYLPGTVGVDVGGDWYDAIQLEDGRIGLVVGDVVGKGVEAAALMGQLRNALRAFAFEHDDPYEVVSRLGRLVDSMMEPPFATLAYLVVDPRGRGVRYVVAGHPPPLIRAPDGSTTFLEGGRALPIGIDASLSFEAGDVQLEEGSTIVLYTDGLVERRGRTLDEGLERLATSATESDGDPVELVDALIAALIGEDERPDDIAVLALRFATAVVDDLRLVVPMTQDGLVEMRHALRAWLPEGNIEADAAAEIVLAVWEACANAVEHAQRPSQPTFGLLVTLDDAGWIRVEVQDSGQWKPGGSSADRGLGLTLMRSLMETVELNTGDAGTTIVMERRVDLRRGLAFAADG